MSPYELDLIVTAILVLLLSGGSLQSQIDDIDLVPQYGRVMSYPPQAELPTRMVYKPLCSSIEKKVEFEDTEYEFEPPHYIETTCTKTGSGRRDLTKEENRQMCYIPGFECVQKHKTATFLRRPKNRGVEPLLKTKPN
ncbi:hypothetical protein GE061_008317 [Apolygus lucorum]|uniref:Uncharacterized protein n=1 Tax=Apolygus lucorum TaxID=248454 RepID=A0A6A4IU82_APOLU|nr:hypothetical protein GE061_008317 [Apolygus lucorum]